MTVPGSKKIWLKIVKTDVFYNKYQKRECGYCKNMENIV